MATALSDPPTANVMPVDYAWPTEKWVTVQAVPVFKEHQTVSAQGKPVRFSYAELVKLAEACNARIQRTGDYPQICIGHTPEDPSQEKPSIGAMGPFRVVPVVEGDKTVYAIVADLHLRRDEADALDKYPRRSVELLIFRDAAGEIDFSRTRLDPLALLGANPPRLDMGLTFYGTAYKGGVEVERYQLCMPAAPAATNVHVPGGGSKERDRYAADPQPSEPDMTDQEIDQLIEKLMSTKPMQFLLDLMRKSEGAAPGPGGAGEPAAAAPVGPAAPPPPPAPPIAPPAPPVPPVPPAHEPPAGPPHPAAPPAAEPPKPEPDKVKDAACYSLLDDPNVPEQVKYAAMQSALAETQAKCKELEDKAQAAEAQRVNSERRAKLETLRFSRVMDVDREFEQVKYGAASDEQFAQAVDRIDKFYTRIPVGHHVPVPDSPQITAPTKEKYSDAQLAEVDKLAKADSAAGRWRDFDTLMAEVLKASK